MENASKALYMAASILVAMMIIGILVYVFRMGGHVGEKYDESQNENQLQLYNSKLEFFQKDNNTISDMVSVINLVNSINNQVDNNENLGVFVDIKIENINIGLSPKFDVEKNYAFLDKSDKIKNITDKIYVYDLISAKKEELWKYKYDTLQKYVKIAISGTEWDNTDTLSKVNKNMKYKYSFICDDIRYHQENGRVSYISFVLVNNTKQKDEKGDPKYVEE